MSSTENGKTPDREGDPLKQQFIGKQTLLLQQLRRLQHDIEEQGQRVTQAINSITEALDTGGNVSPELTIHVKAQMLRAHLQLDDVMEVLNSIDEQAGT